MKLAHFFAVIATEYGYRAVAAMRLDESGFWHGADSEGAMIVWPTEAVVAKFEDSDKAVAALKLAQTTERQFRDLWMRAIEAANYIEATMRQATLAAVKIGSITEDE